MRGFFGIGIENGKAEINLGTLWRSAHIFGASFLFTVGRRYKAQASDVKKSWRSIPLINYESIGDLRCHLPMGCRLIGVEMLDDAEEIDNFIHPEQAVYLLGSEDRGLSKASIIACHTFIRIPGNDCLNVAVAGSIVLYDRLRQWKANGKKIDLPSWHKNRNTGSDDELCA